MLTNGQGGGRSATATDRAGVPAGQGIPQGVPRLVGSIGEAHGKVAASSYPRVHRRTPCAGRSGALSGGIPVSIVEVECGSGGRGGGRRGRIFLCRGPGQAVSLGLGGKNPVQASSLRPPAQIPTEIDHLYARKCGV